ncbi:MAG: beta-ketoacyl-ACP synthase III [Flavobacteriales bacterium]|nr:beta-ketoacyl-ACP synthase III [Flavobacteriales bacterium]
MRDVFITRVSGFLPNAPVGNDDMADVLGMIDGKPSRARAIVLRNNGILKRHYALDRQGNITHTNARLVAEAVRGLTGDGVDLCSVGVLACGTSSPDQLLPSHAAQVHGELDHTMEVVSPSGACCSGMHALKYGYMSVATGDAEKAIATGSELTGPMMRAGNFERETERYRLLDADPIIGFEKEFLRWMLSDGAAAVLLETAPRGPLSFRIEWMKGRSFAHERDVCMYAGGDKGEDGTFHGWKEFPPEMLAGKSLFSMKQDVKLLGANIVELGARFMKETFAEKGLAFRDVDHFLPHISSLFFRDRMAHVMREQGIDIPEERWFINLPEVGNVGSASVFLMLDGLIRSGRLSKGHRVVLMVPESARFSYAGALLTVV